MSYRVLFVSDLHHGSVFGLLPDGFKTSDDRIVGQNPGQAYLWRCWKDLCMFARQLAPDILVVNGEGIDGCQRAQRGTELCLPMVEDQTRAAEESLTLLLSACPERPALYMTQGTEYHEGKAGREMEVLAKNLGAEQYYGLGTGRYSREVLDLDINGVVINVAHHISPTSGFYRATASDREGQWSALAGKEGKAPKADACVRSHVHYFVHVEHASKHIVVTPCWQLQTRFMRKNSVYRMLPDVGEVWLEVDPKAKAAGDDPIIVRKKLYPLPPFVTTKAKLRSVNEQATTA